MNNRMEEFIESLDLPFEGEFQRNVYIITLQNSDEFSEAHTILANNHDLHIDDTSKATAEEASFIFNGDEFEARIIGDFEQDIYRIEIRER